MKVRRPPLAPEQRYGEGSPEGRAIAQLAVSYVRERDTLFIGAVRLPTYC